jgi:toxin-antitoxin system PIN domain toxin
LKVVDANVLLHSLDRRAVRHEVARTWLNTALTGDESVGFPWISLLAFMRISTRRGAFPEPLPLDRAISVMHRWLSQPVALIVHPTARHWEILQGLLGAAGTAGDLVSDAHVAALATEHGAEVVSFDTDFARFPGLRWRMPGEARSRRNPG